MGENRPSYEEVAKIRGLFDQYMATKADVENVRTEIERVRTEVANVKGDLGREIENVRSTLKTLQWIIPVGLVLVTVIIGFLNLLTNQIIK